MSLYAAVASCNEEAVKKLLEKEKYSPVKEDLAKETSFMCAVRKGNVEIVRLLLQSGATANENDGGGVTPLHKCAYNKGDESVKIATELLANGAILDAKDNSGTTPLWEALFAENTTMMRFLINCGADVNAQQVRGESILFGAIRYAKGNKITKMLLEAGATMEVPDNMDPLICQAVFCHSDIMQLLLDYGANSEQYDSLSRTPIMIAVENSLTYQVRVLAEYGADLTPFNSKGQTCLYVAVLNGDIDIVWTLMINGANPELDELQPTVWELSRNNLQMRKALFHFWTPQTHFRHPKRVRDAIKSVLIIAKRENWKFDKPIMHLLFSYIAFTNPKNIR